MTQRTLMDFIPKAAVKRPRSPSPKAPAASTLVSATSVDAVSSTRWLEALLTNPQWHTFLTPLLVDSWNGGTFAKIEVFLDEQAARGKVVLPPRALIFSAFQSAPFDRLKVVLIGQDPYHDIGQAHGLCFSVQPGVRVPPSLVNMYKELSTDISDFKTPSHGYLQSWAEQGMLMLNATLTVEAHQANSHKDCGWQQWTDAVIHLLSEKHPNRLVFLLWGNFAKKKKSLINTSRHIVLESAHPSPLSVRYWDGCKCFSKCNRALEKLGHAPMDWTLPPTVQK